MGRAPPFIRLLFSRTMSRTVSSAQSLSASAGNVKDHLNAVFFDPTENGPKCMILASMYSSWMKGKNHEPDSPLRTAHCFDHLKGQRDDRRMGSPFSTEELLCGQ